MKIKLSKNQLEVLELMNSGWELGYTSGIKCEGRYWAQKGGLGRGGETKDFSKATIYKLIKLKLIINNPYLISDRTYKLTDKGIECISNNGVLYNETKKEKLKQLKVFGGSLDGQNRTIVACKSLKQFSEITDTSYNYCRNYCCETGNEKEIKIALEYPFKSIILDNMTYKILKIKK